MPSKRVGTAIEDILEHIDLAERFVAGFDFSTFIKDTRTIYAAVRCLEIISEASRRLPAEFKERHPSVG